MTTKNNRARNGIDYFMDAETRRSYGTYYKEIMGFITLIRSAKSVLRERFAKNDYIELNGKNSDYYLERV